MTQASLPAPVEKRRRVLLSALLALGVAGQLALVLRLNVNWDEFWFLGRIHLAEDGLLGDPFQNFHVWMLGWVADLPANAVDQVVAGRIVMAVCVGVSLLCLYSVARRFVSGATALLLVTLWFSSLYSLPHGASFRTDPLSAALMMGALAILFSPARLWASAIAGALAAVSLLVTVKAVFYLPAFLAALVVAWSRDGWRPALVRFSVAGVSLVAMGLALWSWHVAEMTVPSAAAPPVALDQAVAANQVAAHRMFADPDRDGQLIYFAYWAFGSLASVALLVGATVLFARDLMTARRRGLATAFLACLLIVLTPFVFRNAFPYFYPFILFPILIAGIPMARWLTEQSQPWLEALLVIALAGIVGQLASYLPRDQEAQRAYLDAVDAAFPEPVAYVERGTMIPAFRKSGFFMSSLGIENSVRPGGPRLGEAIRRDHPPLLILSVPALRAAVGRDPGGEGRRLHPEDEAVLAANYVEYWGDLWIAGKRLDSPSGRFEMVIPGRYLLDCKGDRTIAGRRHACGDEIALEEGDVSYEGGAMTLRWADVGTRPLAPPPDGPIYHQL